MSDDTIKNSEELTDSILEMCQDKGITWRLLLLSSFDLLVMSTINFAEDDDEAREIIDEVCRGAKSCIGSGLQ